MRFPINLILLVPLALALAACGGGGDSGTDSDAPAAFVVVTTPMADGVVGVPYAYQFNSAHGTSPVTWAFTTGFTPPAWLSLSTTGLASGTPTATGNVPVQVTATDATARTAAITLDFDVIAAPQITTTSIARAIKGQPYAEQLPHNAPGGLPVSFAIAGGSLPTGISFGSSGDFSGSTSQGGLFELEIGLYVGVTQVDSALLDLVVYESIPFTYTQDSIDATALNNTTGTATQLFAGSTPIGRMTMADRHVQSAPLTLNSDQNISVPDASDFFKFNIGAPGTIKVEVFFRDLVGDLDVYLWRYAGPPTHAISIVASDAAFGTDDALIEYHNAQLSGSLGAGYYYLEVRAPGDPVAGLWNRNAYSFRVTFNDLTIASEKLEVDSPSGAAINTQIVATNQGVAPTAPQWSLVSGVLPAGVTLTTDGRFTGTPTQFGMYDFVVRVQDGALAAQRAIRVRFFDSNAGNFWQVKGERRLFSGGTNPIFEAYGDAMVVAPHPAYPTEGAIYVLGGRTNDTLDRLHVFNTDRAGIPAAEQFKFKDIAKNLLFPRRYHGAAYVQHSYGGYIYVLGGEIGAASGGHSVGDFFTGVERLQVADGAGVALSHPLSTNWELVASLPGTEGALTIKGWAEFGLAVNDAAGDAHDRIYLVGGKYQLEDGVGTGTFSMKFHNAVLMFECPTTAVATGTWHRKLDSNPYSPVRFPAVSMLNGRIYVAAGRSGTVGQTGSGGTPSTGIQMYQPDPASTNPALATADVSQFPSLTEAVYYPMFATLGGKLYIWCGWDGQAVPTGTRRLQSFEPNGGGVGGTVTRLCDADWGTGFGGGVAHDGKLWIISGIGHGTESLPLNLRYQP